MLFSIGKLFPVVILQTTLFLVLSLIYSSSSFALSFILLCHDTVLTVLITLQWQSFSKVWQHVVPGVALMSSIG